MPEYLLQGEVQLAGWQDSHTGGAKVILWLPDPAMLEPFRAMTVRKGNTAGQILMAVLVEVDDEGQPVKPPHKPQLLSAAAAMMCDNPAFWSWLNATYGYEPKDEAEAATALREALGIESRSELDSNPDVARRFHETIRKPFAAWQPG